MSSRFYRTGSIRILEGTFVTYSSRRSLVIRNRKLTFVTEEDVTKISSRMNGQPEAVHGTNLVNEGYHTFVCLTDRNLNNQTG
jgi:hypothetical protein